MRACLHFLISFLLSSHRYERSGCCSSKFSAVGESLENMYVPRSEAVLPSWEGFEHEWRTRMAEAHSLIKDEAHLRALKDKLETAETIDEIKTVVGAVLDFKLAAIRREVDEAPLP